MSSQQIIVLIILIVYLVANTVIGLVYGRSVTAAATSARKISTSSAAAA